MDEKHTKISQDTTRIDNISVPIHIIECGAVGDI